MCTFMSFDIGIISTICCDTINNAALDLYMDNSLSSASYADAVLCEGTCYDRTVESLLLVQEQLPDRQLAQEFVDACVAFGGSGVINTPAPSPAPTPAPTVPAQTAAPTTVNAELIAKMTLSPRFDKSHFTGGVLYATVANQVFKSVRDAAYASSTMVNATLTSWSAVDLTLNVRSTKAGKNDELECLFLGGFSLGVTDYDCCISLNMMASEIFISSASTGRLANGVTCAGTCANTVISALLAAEEPPFTKTGAAQPFIDTCFDVFTPEMQASYPESTLAPTSTPLLPCIVGGVDLGTPPADCCEHITEHGVSLLSGYDNIVDFVGNTSSVLCATESCRASTEKFLKLYPPRPGRVYSEEYNAICAGNPPMLQTQCSATNPVDTSVEIDLGVVDIDCCNSIKWMSARLIENAAVVGPGLSPQFASGLSCADSCLFAAETLLMASEKLNTDWAGKLHQPFVNQCSTLTKCSIFGNDLGYTTDSCCQDLVEQAPVVIDSANPTPVVQANQDRCSTKWSCFDKFALGIGYAEHEFNKEDVLSTFIRDCYDLMGEEQIYEIVGYSGGNTNDNSADLDLIFEGIKVPSYGKVIEEWCRYADMGLCLDHPKNPDCYMSYLNIPSLLDPQFVVLSGGLCPCTGDNLLCPECVAKLNETSAFCMASTFVEVTVEASMNMGDVALPSSNEERALLILILEEAIKWTVGESGSVIVIKQVGNIVVNSRRSLRFNSRSLSSGDVKFEMRLPLGCESADCGEMATKGVEKLDAAVATLNEKTSASCTSRCFTTNVDAAGAVVLSKNPGIATSTFAAALSYAEDVAAVVTTAEKTSDATVSDPFTERPSFQGNDPVVEDDDGGSEDEFSIIGAAPRVAGCTWASWVVLLAATALGLHNAFR